MGLRTALIGPIIEPPDQARDPADRADLVVIGAGIVGLATALRLVEQRPDLQVVILEKEATVASHQTGHNSGVVHAGLYYEPGSLKARLCREGKRELEDYCQEHGVPIERTGKLVVAVEMTELPRFENLRERAMANEVPGLKEIGPEGIREIEPHAVGIRALWSPDTSIVDFLAVARAFAADVEARGARIETDREVVSIARRGDEMVMGTTRGDIVARRVIACAGLQADHIAALAGDGGHEHPRIVPFRGDYYSLTPEARHLVRGLIYPVPDPRFPFLGVHLTRRIGGEVLAGPNAVLATAREGYRRRDLSFRDVAETLSYPGFLRLARRYWRMGAGEMWRDWSRRAFLSDVRRFVPALSAQHLVFGPSGVRAQALGRDGRLVDDFLLGGSDRVLHVFNAPSPAATSSLAIGRVLAGQAIGRLGL
ncbi:MAG TPA: L-2-hydroxyglutarate oxidase [Candidatus Limnocylindrales bacterium]|nr:L-2-hydroxyglutarate oxidase [Candidatus Limnocylindrales bacterium]